MLFSFMPFVGLHAFQYIWDGVISVIFVGIVFALILRHYYITVAFSVIWLKVANLGSIKKWN